MSRVSTQFGYALARIRPLKRYGYRNAPPAIVDVPRVVIAPPMTATANFPVPAPTNLPAITYGTATASMPAPTLIIQIDAPVAVATASFPIISSNQDVTVIAVPGVATASIPDVVPTQTFYVVPAIATAGMQLPALLGVATIVFAQPATATASFPVPCLDRTLPFTVRTAGSLTLAPLLPPDTCD